MRGSPPAWPRPLLLVALAISVACCSLSLRGGANPVGLSNTPSPFVAAGPPVVEIASPADGAPAEVGRTVDFDVRGGDPWPIGIARLELFVGDTLVDRVLTAGGANRLSFGAILGWTPTAPGVYQASAYAYRADGTASIPASIMLNVTGNALPSTAIPSPTESLAGPGASASASLVPTVTLSPSPPPTPSPKPTPKPTPTPTPQPIAVHIDVWVETSEIPDWTVGTGSILTIHVQNIGQATVSYVKVIASLAGSEGRARTGSLRPGEATTLAIQLTPQADGTQLLSVRGRLPPGYVDSDPSSNTLIWENSVNVAPAPTAVPTASGAP